jgi:hypothetical protein
MIQFQDGDRAVEIERDVLELHCFLLSCVYALSAARQAGSVSTHI